MIIYYEQIKEEGLNLDLSFDFNEDSDKYSVSFNGYVARAGDAYVVSGQFDVDFSCPCDRCLEETKMSFHEDLIMTLSPLGEYPEMQSTGEEGLTDEEAGMYVTPTDHFNLEDLLREEAFLIVPDKRLCKEDCKGICPDCGASLNTDKCKCEAKVDERWSALAKLKDTKK